MTTANKTALITGTTSDIGKALCTLLLQKNCDLICINRSESKANKVTQDLLQDHPNANITNYVCDLSCQKEIETVCSKIAKSTPAIDYLFHNAGVLVAQKEFSKQSIEMHFAVNTLAPYLITEKLKAQLNAADEAFVVVSGSGASKMARNIKTEDLVNPEHYKAMSGAYANSKSCIKVLMASLQDRYKESNIHFSVVDLPPTKTKMAKSEAMPGLFRFFSFLFSSPESSAKKLFRAANPQARVLIEKHLDSVKQPLVQLANSLAYTQAAPSK